MTEIKTPDITPWGALLRLGGTLIVAALVSGAIGAWPTCALAGNAGLVGMTVGLCIALVAALGGVLPIIVALPLDPPRRLTAQLAGMALRFVLALGLLIAAILTGYTAKLPLALWTAIGYIVLLAVDTVGLTWLLRRSSGRITT